MLIPKVQLNSRILPNLWKFLQQQLSKENFSNEINHRNDEILLYSRMVLYLTEQRSDICELNLFYYAGIYISLSIKMTILTKIISVRFSRKFCSINMIYSLMIILGFNNQFLGVTTADLSTSGDTGLFTQQMVCS